MTRNEVLAKYEMSTRYLRSFAERWANNYNDLSYFLDEGYFCWVAQLLESAGVLEEDDDDPCVQCLRELARLPDAQEERDAGISHAYVSICPSCNAHHFFSYNDMIHVRREVFTTCFQNGCKGTMKVTDPSKKELSPEDDEDVA